MRRIQIGCWAYHRAHHFPFGTMQLNYPKMEPAKVQALIDDGRFHSNLMCSLYRRQVAKGICFLHEHPATALSWKEDQIDALARNPHCHVVVGDQGRYGLTSKSAADPNERLPAMKPTKIMSNSSIMASRLKKRCLRDHVHQPLVSGRCKETSFYPAPVVKAILKGITLRAKERRVANCHPR